MNDCPQGAGPWQGPHDTWHPPQSTLSSTSGLTTEQQFLHDAAAARDHFERPECEGGYDFQSGSESTAAIYSLATSFRTDLNNGTTGIHLSHDDAAKLVGLAIKDACPTAGK